MSEGDLVAEISRYVCARWSAEDSAWLAAFADPHCVRGGAEGVVADAVRQAMFDVQPIVRLSEDAYPSAYRYLESAPDSSAQEKTRVLQEIWWQDPLLGSNALRRSIMLLGAEGVACADCRRSARPPARVVSWPELTPYVRAYVWPVAGHGEGEPVEMFVCGSVNGSAQTEGDVRLLRAGFLVAQGFVEDPVAREELQTVIGPESRATRTLEGAKAAVKQFVASPTALASACRTLRTLEWFSGVQVTECERS